MKEKLNIRPKCLKNFYIAESFLKKAVHKKLTLYDIAQIMYRTDPEVKTEFEKLIEIAEDNFINNKKNSKMIL